MNDLKTKIAAFAALLEAQQRERYARDYPRTASDAQDIIDRACQVTVKGGKKYTKVDVGTSGKYMVEMDSGSIFGIKAYGVIHRGHQYGNLDTIHKWDWSGYTAIPLPPVTYPAIPQDTLAIG